MRAKVTKAFNGVEDGQVYPRHIHVDEIIEGDLAKVAVEENWAAPVVDDSVVVVGIDGGGKDDVLGIAVIEPAEETTVPLRSVQADLLRTTAPAQPRRK